MARRIGALASHAAGFHPPFHENGNGTGWYSLFINANPNGRAAGDWDDWDYSIQTGGISGGEIWTQQRPGHVAGAGLHAATSRLAAVKTDVRRECSDLRIEKIRDVGKISG